MPKCGAIQIKQLYVYIFILLKEDLTLKNNIYVIHHTNLNDCRVKNTDSTTQIPLFSTVLGIYYNLPTTVIFLVSLI